MRTNSIFGHVRVFVPVSVGKYKFVIEHRQCPDGYSQLRSTTFTGNGENRFHTYGGPLLFRHWFNRQMHGDYSDLRISGGENGCFHHVKKWATRKEQANNRRPRGFAKALTYHA